MAPSPTDRPWRPNRRRRLAIGLTPLIDVVFILLVFFMLASSFLDWRSIALDAPRTAAAGTSMEGAVLVEVRGDGLRLGGETMPLDRLVRRVAEAVAGRPDRRILIRPGDGVPVQSVVTVLDRLTTNGIGNLSLVRGPG